MLDIIGTIFIITLGTGLHFLYDLTKHNKFIGFFAAVNESTWEHLKLVIAPTFLWFIVEIHFYSDRPDFLFARFIGLLVSLLIIPLIFYTYTHFTKKPILAVDIASFMIAIIIGQLIFHAILSADFPNQILNHIGIIGLILIFIQYITHTYVPHRDFLYKDPLTNKYGIAAHTDHVNKNDSTANKKRA